MNVCIYGMGRYGISTYYKLVERGIRIRCFGDQSTEKHGCIVRDTKCISFEDVMQLDKKRTVIIVAIKKNNSQLIQLFREKGFKYVCSYSKIRDKMNKEVAPPLISTSQILDEKRYIERAILENTLYDEISVSNDIKEMVDALRKRGRYEGVRG